MVNVPTQEELDVIVADFEARLKTVETALAEIQALIQQVKNFVCGTS